MTDLLEVNKLLTKTIKDTRNAPGGKASPQCRTGAEVGTSNATGDEASPRCRTGAEAGMSIDNRKGSVDGESNRVEAKDEKASENTNAGGDSEPTPDGESSTGSIEDGTPDDPHRKEEEQEKQKRHGCESCEEGRPMMIRRPNQEGAKNAHKG